MLVRRPAPPGIRPFLENKRSIQGFLFIVQFIIDVVLAVVIVVIVVALIVLIAIVAAPIVDALDLRGMLAMIEVSDHMNMLAPQRSASQNIRRVGGRGHSGRPQEEHKACLTPNSERRFVPFG